MILQNFDTRCNRGGSTVAENVVIWSFPAYERKTITYAIFPGPPKVADEIFLQLCVHRLPGLVQIHAMQDLAGGLFHMSTGSL